MGAISNDNIKDKLNSFVDWAGFVPSLTFAHNFGAKTITITDASTYPGGDSRKIVKVEVRDANAKKVIDSISAADVDNAITISTATLDYSDGLTILATVVTTIGRISDGHATGINGGVTAGAVGSWDYKEVNVL